MRYAIYTFLALTRAFSLAAQSLATIESQIAALQQVRSAGQIALDRIYPVDQTATISAGSGWLPQAAVFDGQSIWIANWIDGTVSKLRASDGATLGVFPVGNSPAGAAFDGAYVWISNSVDNTISKL